MTCCPSSLALIDRSGFCIWDWVHSGVSSKPV